jgi:CHAT domain-containing protein
MVHRQMALRQQALQQTMTPTIRKLHAQYVDTRRELARLTMAPADPSHVDAKHARLTALSNRKEDLERKLADKLPDFRRQLEQPRRPHADLCEHLPQGTVFVDLLHYCCFEQTRKVPGVAGRRWTRSYVAFVLRPGSPVTRVELGPAEPIEKAVAAWRNEIVTGRSGSAADDLRRLVWEPLEKSLTDETQTVFLCPDGALTALPWAALPGRQKNSVLLEEYAFAVVPYGQFLLEQLTSEPTAKEDQGLLLAVGDVNYDDKPITVAEPVLLTSRAAARGERQLHWAYLPGTKLEHLVTAAGNRQVLKLTGNEASTAQVLAELPKARWAHLATHGFFADPKFRSALQLDEKAFERQQFFLTGERTTVAGRNPLVLSGLVLAGANLPRETDEFGIPRGDGGILTAEAIAGLPLGNLELAVLSACETGLGEVAGGEGVFGLQRAFHLAGAHTTVGSLWKVDDEVTRQLMTAFYNNMWQKGMGKLEALRQAQLSILKVEGASASIRGPGAQNRKRPAVSPDQRPDPRLWAAWVLSGDPGTLTFARQPTQPPDTQAAHPPGTFTTTAKPPDARAVEPPGTSAAAEHTNKVPIRQE